MWKIRVDHINYQLHWRMGGKHILEGTLESADEYLNMHLTSTVEIVNGERSTSLGSVVLRGNNIIIINPIEN